jgi:hypothetical protein
MHGTGTINYANGNRYIGDWVEGKRTGRGVFTWSDGDQYEIRCSQISGDRIYRCGIKDLHPAHAITE